METFSAITSIVLSAISLGIAVVAIIQTNRQIKLSNKQHLFDRRVKCYSFFKELMFLFENNYKNLNNDRLLQAPDFCIDILTNNARLEDMANITDDVKNMEYKRIFLSKCEMFESIATEMELIWDKKEICQVAKFVRQYKDLLKELNKQNISMYLLQESNSIKGMNLDEFNKKVHNQKLINLFNEIVMQYENICDDDIITKLSKSIRL